MRHPTTIRTIPKMIWPWNNCTIPTITTIAAISHNTTVIEPPLASTSQLSPAHLGANRRSLTPPLGAGDELSVAGLAVRRVHRFGLGRAALTQEHRQHDDGADGE